MGLQCSLLACHRHWFTFPIALNSCMAHTQWAQSICYELLGLSTGGNVFSFQDFPPSKYLVKLSCKWICDSAYPYPLSRLLTPSVLHMSVPLQPSTVCPSPSLSMHLMEVGNPVRCLQQALPNLLANACARSSVIASSALGGMKVALVNSNWNAK